MENSSSRIIDFTLVYNKHKTGLFNYALKMISHQSTAEDLIQSLFLKLFENMGNLKNPDSVVYWLYKTLRNDIYTIFRLKKARVDQFKTEDTDEIEVCSNEDIEHEIETRDLRHFIYVELNKMDPDQKEVYLLKEFGSLSYREISEVMGISENLVKSRLFKTRKKLINKISKIIE